VITFSLGSAQSHIESIRKDKLAVWIAQQEAHLTAAVENNSEISERADLAFSPLIEQYNAEIADLEKELKPLGLLGVSVFLLVLAQILISLRAMAEVSPQQAFPYVWIAISIGMLTMAAYGLAILVYGATGIGQSRNRE